MKDQISIFDWLDSTTTTSNSPMAHCLGEYMGSLETSEPEGWVLALVNDAEYVIHLGNHTVALTPYCGAIPEGNKYFYYQVDERVYSAIGVG